MLFHKEYECEEYDNIHKMVSSNAEQIIHLAAQNSKAFYGIKSF